MEREWEQTHAKIIDGLLAIGSMFGDDEALMRAKAECIHRVLREIVEDIPAVHVTLRLPEDLDDARHVEMISEAVRLSALKGIEVAMTHSVNVLMSNIYDICTSKLGKTK